MKKGIIPAGILFLFLINLNTIYSQPNTLCQFIGKKLNSVVSKFGKPLHRDTSNPAMEYIFYQNNSYKLAFIADNGGVYQIQADYFYNSKNDANKELEKFILECGSKGLTVDTVKTGDYKIDAPGVRMNLTLFNNTFSKKYEVKFKADRSESK
jgi:hypothetical protein